MKKFRKKKPVVVEAVQFTGSKDSRDEIFLWMDEHEECCESRPFSSTEGTEQLWFGDGEVARPMDWIVLNEKGDFEQRAPDVFAATYEPAEELAK